MTWNCPECAGIWLRDFVFQHDLACSILASEDATQFNDLELLRARRWHPFTRASTLAEWTLGHVFDPEWQPVFYVDLETDRAMTQVSATTPSIRARIVGGIDPNQLEKGTTP